MASTTIHKEERPLKELFSELFQEVGTMFRDELALAKAEMSVKIKQEIRDVAMVAIGGIIIYAGLFFLLGSVVAALWLVMPLWLSSLLVGIVTMLAGYLMIQKGKKEMQEREMKPTETIETVKESKEWIQKKR
jgi:ABC-type siderophore export system fused ATPase/permease subunit